MKKILVLGMFIFAMSGFSAMAEHHEGHAKGGKGPSKEEREMMAKSHDQMAACLRSDKSMKECHEEKRAACEANPESCPMMGRMKHMRGMKGKKGHGNHGGHDETDPTKPADGTKK